jgi:hypothetical protein
MLEFTVLEGFQITGTAAGAPVTVSAWVRDDVKQEGLFSGVATVTVSVDGAPASPLTLVTPGSPANWRATVHLSAAGSHDLTVTVEDKAGNRRANTRTVVVTLSVTVTDVTRQTYLRDLLDFSARRLLTSGGGPGVTAGRLEEELGQPLRTLALGDRVYAYEPVRTLRVVTDVLARSLGGLARAPLAHWPISQGSGSSVSDDTGGDAHGTVVNRQGRPVPGVWTGQGGDRALVLDGAVRSVLVAPLPRLRVRDTVTIAGRVRFDGSGSDPAGAVVLAKEGEYAVGRTAGGTLRWAVGPIEPARFRPTKSRCGPSEGSPTAARRRS